MSDSSLAWLDLALTAASVTLIGGVTTAAVFANRELNVAASASRIFNTPVPVQHLPQQLAVGLRVRTAPVIELRDYISPRQARPNTIGTIVSYDSHNDLIFWVRDKNDEIMPYDPDELTAVGRDFSTEASRRRAT